MTASLDERQLRPGEQEFDRLMACAPDIVSRFDRQLRHLYVNAAVEPLTGLPPEAFIGRTSRELGMPEELCVQAEQQLAAVFEQGEPRRFEVRFDDLDGRAHWLEILAVAERSPAGEVETLVAFTRDRTEARQAEQDKLASEMRYRELFERAMDMIVVLDRQGRLVEVSPAVTETLGYQPEELLGRSLFSVMAPEEAEAATARLARKLDRSEPATLYRSVVLGKDGRRVPIEVSSQVLPREGEPGGVLAIARDISDEAAVRAALEESERRFRTAFESAAVGMVITDPQGTLLRVNDAFAEMLGYSAVELAGMEMRDIVHPVDMAASVPDIERLHAGVEQRRVIEKRYLRRNGTIAIGHVAVSAVRAEDGSPLYFVAQVEDVTELRQVQAKLEDSQALHRIVIESSPDVLSVLDPDGTVRLVSGSVADTLGFSGQELVGRSYQELIHPDDRPALRATIDAAVNGEDISVVRSRVLAKDGSVHVWDGTIASGFDQDGGPSFLVANARDVTAQMALEDQLRQAQKMQAVGRLAGGVAHDFNNLLLAIRAYADLALHKAADQADNSEELGEIDAAAERAASLTAQLLAFSRRQMLKPELLDLRDVVGEMVNLLRRLIGEDVELSTRWPQEPTLIRADRTQIGQVIANLAVNARDAMPDGGHLAVEIRRSPSDRQALLIVRDDGAGMDATTCEQIFEPFFTTKGSQGTGLGLSTVHGIVIQSGGEIEVDSAPGQGTTFTIRLPLADAEPAEVEEEVVKAAPGGAETVLLVEDDPTVRTVLTRMLDRYGYRLLTAGSGAQAVELARTSCGRLDLLITDLVMNGLNGRETAEAILAVQPQARVLYMSGYTDDTVLRVGHFEPGTSFIQKPFSADELARRVRELLDHRGGLVPVGEGAADARAVGALSSSS
jgi:two-component system cell cycle sensor histidine kinase/response regulator CckA